MPIVNLCKACGRPVRKEGNGWVHYDEHITHPITLQVERIGEKQDRNQNRYDIMAIWSAVQNGVYDDYAVFLELVKDNHDQMMQIIRNTDIDSDTKLNILARVLPVAWDRLTRGQKTTTKS